MITYYNIKFDKLIINLKQNDDVLQLDERENDIVVENVEN